MQRLILSVKHIRADNDAPQVPDDSEAESSSCEFLSNQNPIFIMLALLRRSV